MVGHHPVITAGAHKHELLLDEHHVNHSYSYVADCEFGETGHAVGGPHPPPRPSASLQGA